MSDDDDDFPIYGTPLPPLDEVDSVRAAKLAKLEDDYVKDKQGRRRFHGAFTGGFSAGYFNSVGTKEGWTPSTFVSSRGQRSDNKRQHVQDFMDDEDMEEHGIAPITLQRTKAFDDSESTKRKRVLDEGPIPGVPVLEGLLAIPKETIGMQLLRKLGWKPGQGVGPRLSRKQKRMAKKERKRMYEKRMQKGFHDDEESSDSQEEADDGITFAPDDVPGLEMPDPKTNRFGLGYKPLEGLSHFGGHVNLFDPAPLRMMEKKKKVLIKGQAFGVGAFEDEDEDIYSTEDMSQYDFDSGDQVSKPGTSGKGRFSVQEVHGLAKALEGFALSTKPFHVMKLYPVPSIPKDFVPNPKTRRRRFEKKPGEVDGLGRHTLTAADRSRILAEKPKVKVEVKSGTRGEVLPPSTSRGIRRDMEAKDIEALFEEMKEAAATSPGLMSNFKPFAKDEAKQKRYELYLRMKERGQKNKFSLAQPRDMVEWEKEREVREFERASQLFKPLPSTMASRFVSGVVQEDTGLLKDGLNTNVSREVMSSQSDGGGSSPTEVRDERVKAARLKMFGKLTQEKVEWHPDSLLCRRFNVPNPYPGSSRVGVPASAKKDKYSIFDFLHAPTEATAGLGRAPSQKEEEEEGKKASGEASDGDEEEEAEEKPEEDNYGLKVPVDGPPTRELFRAIFLSSSSSSSEAEDEDEDRREKKRTKKKNTEEGRSEGTSDSEKEDKDDTKKKKNQAFSAVDSFVASLRRKEKKTKKKNTEGRSEGSSDSEEEDTDDTKNKKNPAFSAVDSFLASMRSNDIPKEEDEEEEKDEKRTKPQEAPSAVSRAGASRPRVSRFSPKDEDMALSADILPKPVFIRREKESSGKKAEEEGVEGEANKGGIFANIDFAKLNSYRTHTAAASRVEDDRGGGDEGGGGEGGGGEGGDVESKNSSDSEGEYGPALPQHLLQRPSQGSSLPPAPSPFYFPPQAKSGAPVVRHVYNKGLTTSKNLWVPKEEAPAKKHKKHKHKNKHKSKKEKKKRHKEHKKKKKKKASSSSSSSFSSKSKKKRRSSESNESSSSDSGSEGSSGS